MKQAKLQFYKDEDGKHRWRLTDKSNGKIIAASSESYSRKHYAIKNAYLILFSDNVEVEILGI